MSHHKICNAVVIIGIKFFYFIDFIMIFLYVVIL